MRPAFLLLALTAGVQAASTGGRVDYAAQVKPVLASRCYACHGALKQQHGLRLDTASFMRKGGKHGPVIVADKPDKSRLIERITAPHESDRMPPEGEPLKPEQIAAITAWIKQGAPAPSNEQPEFDPRDHWAFKPPVKSMLPKIGNRQSAIGNPVDSFLEATRRKQPLVAAPPADKSIWLRRVTLDLIGLPPTLAELREFEADTSPQAREKVVERLLASPHYGERWGRHFLDIWRYSDWWGLGAQLRYSQKHIWHWRDWLVESLNADKGYDRMIVEQLAADELAPEDLDALRATGFLARSYYLFNRTTWLDDVVEHTSRGLLGLTMNCVKCHDHKYDPLTVTDYYSMRAIFEPYHTRLDELPGEADLETDGLPRIFDIHLDLPTFIHMKGDEKRPDTNTLIRPAVPAVLAFARFEPQPVALPRTAHQPALRSFVLDNHLRAAEKQISDANAALEKARPTNSPPAGDAAVRVAELALAAARLRPAMVQSVWNADAARSKPQADSDFAPLVKSAAAAEAKFKLAQAEADLAKVEAERATAAAAKKKEDPALKLKAAKDALEKAQKTAAAPGTNYTSIRATLKAQEGPDETEAHRALPYPATSTGRRLAFARWIADRQNPLTARVLVNHVWTRHFGQPLVANLTDFGRRSPAPQHQELLDWLAVDFMEHGWSLKHLHRAMVLSEAYRMSSDLGGRSSTSARNPAPTRSRGAGGTAPSRSDPENKLYWRMNASRMDSHALRDSLLHLAGLLDPKLGGPTIDPKKEDTAFRRSLYFTQSPEDLNKFLEMFDNASTKECYRRAESILPQQALALANSKLAATAAAKLAERVAKDCASADDGEFVRAAFETILAFKPATAEVEASLDSIAKLRAALTQRKHSQPEAKARADFILALLNHNDFITVR
jgi:mono/diheme cytochrome c family protein